MTKRITILIAAVAAVLLAATAASAKSTDTTITGAGSTFVQPLVAAWTPAIGKAFGYTVQYSGVGSGAGIAAITANQVDFGASDAPLNQAQQSACPDCIQIPWALSATAVAYNVPGAPAHINLDGNTISKIFLGTISNWSDPAIAALNKGANLPDLKITPVFRSDGSGTSYNFTDYLSSVNASWKNKIGTSTQPAFPAGQGAKGSSGVAGLDHPHERRDRLRRRRLRDQEPHQVRRGAEQGREVPLPEPPPDRGGRHRIHDGACEQRAAHREPAKSATFAYPISTYTYIIVHKKSAHAAELRKMIFWALTQGQQSQFAAKLTFAKMSTVKKVLVAAEKTLKQIQATGN